MKITDKNRGVILVDCMWQENMDEFEHCPFCGGNLIITSIESVPYDQYSITVTAKAVCWECLKLLKSETIV